MFFKSCRKSGTQSLIRPSIKSCTLPDLVALLGTIIPCTNRHRLRAVLGQAYRGLTSGFLLLRIFSVDISVSPHVCFIFNRINSNFYVSKIMHL